MSVMTTSGRSPAHGAEHLVGGAGGGYEVKDRSRFRQHPFDYNAAIGDDRPFSYNNSKSRARQSLT